MIVLKWVLIFILGVLAVITGMFIWNYVFGVRLQEKLFKQMNSWFDDDEDTDESNTTKVGEATTCTTANSKQSTSKA